MDQMQSMGPASTASRVLGGGQFLNTALWDLSNFPTTNDRRAKLGRSQLGAHAMAIAGFDDETKIARLGYGFEGPLSFAPMEPDNYVYLEHGPGDNVWAHRDIVDHENHSATIAERSDIVVNQKKRMCWSYKKDMQWVVEIEDIGAPIPKGREFNGAGFLPSLYANGRSSSGFTKKGLSGASFIFPKRTAKGFEFGPVETKSNQAKGKIRAVLAFNINQRGAYMTDGLRVVQFHHFGFAMPRSKPPPKPRFEPVETPSNQGGSYRPGGGPTGSPYVPGGGSYNPNDPQNKARDTGLKVPPGAEHKPGTITFEKSGGPDSDCMVEPWVGANRPDVWWDVEGKDAAFAFVDERPPRGEDLYEGAFIVATPSPRHPKYRPAEDQSTDQPILEHPDATWGLRPAVWLPRETGVPPSCQLNSDIGHADGSYSTAGHAPPASTGGGADAGEWSQPVPINDNGMTKLEFTAGYLTYVKERIPMPMSSPESRLEILIPYTIPVNLAGGTQMDFRLFWKPSLAPGQDFPTEWTEMTKSITAGDNPTGTQQLRWLKFEIPRIGLAYLGGAGGGQIDVWFMRRSDDTAAGKAFLLAGAIRFARAPITSTKRLALSGVV
jgi:hypothetical protein